MRSWKEATDSFLLLTVEDEMIQYQLPIPANVQLDSVQMHISIYIPPKGEMIRSNLISVISVKRILS